ncbi:hypothetical protein ANO11243_059110 [Dothideomycetidae sp. 11243]|nr:hypothetical protein ANO11243_059110 [fungal sp. No.11243]
MDELQARHRKEAKELQARITSKKKQATKKTRKGVNDECDRLEQETKERHAAEIAALDGPSADSVSTYSHDTHDTDITNGMSAMSIDRYSTASSQSVRPPSMVPSIASGTSASTADTSASTPAQQSRRPNRVRARMERRRAEQDALFAKGAAEAQHMPDLKAVEREQMVNSFRLRRLVEKEIRADGHCLYSAFADQMEFKGMSLGDTKGMEPKVGLFKTFSNGLRGSSPEDQVERYKVVRRAAGDYMIQHPDDFAPFLDEDFGGYVHKVKDTAEWGGQLELMALARRYDVQINVIQGDGRVEEIVPEGKANDEATILWLAYYRHGFGLGEHYNSLRKVG